MFFVSVALLIQEEVYLSERQALERIFTKCDRIICSDLDLSDEAYKKVSDELRRSDTPKKHRVFLGFQGHEHITTAIITEEIGKYQPITFVVAVDAKGAVRDVLVMVYRESIGSDIKKQWWLEQFKGKTVDDPIKRGRDIIKISGATLSCDAVARGVKKVLAVLRHQQVYKITRYVMGSLCTISVYGEDDKKAAEAVEGAFDEMKKWDQILSNYNEKSELCQLTNGVKISSEMEWFIKTSLAFSEKTEGAFDVTIEPAVRAWGFFSKELRIPGDDELKKLASVVGYGGLGLKDGRAIMKDGMRLDPGGIGKGVAVDGAAKVLKEKGAQKFVVDFGSTILPCNMEIIVAIRNPFDGLKPLGFFKLKDMALSTSGAYEKVFQKDGKRYAHIIDPRTLKPVEGVSSVSVVAQTATESDALSTAVFVKKEIKWCEGMVVFDDKKIDMSAGFKKSFEESK
jgi:thiamine biosynthesis lipoprotein